MTCLDGTTTEGGFDEVTKSMARRRTECNVKPVFEPIDAANSSAALHAPPDAIYSDIKRPHSAAAGATEARSARPSRNELVTKPSPPSPPDGILGGVRRELQSGPLTNALGFQAYFKAPNAGAGDKFGRAVAISGDTIVSGAPSQNSGYGMSYVYVRTGATWTFQAYLLKGPRANHFGHAVAISGDTIVIGAPYEDSCSTSISTVAATDNGCSGAGASYIFVRTGTTWTFQMYLKAPNADAGSMITPMPAGYFGCAVAISSDTIVIGAYGEGSCSTSISTVAATDNGCGASGATYVYVRTGTTWTFQKYLKAPNAGAADMFGRAVAISEDTIVIGAHNEDSCSTSISTVAPTDNGCSQAGASYVYVRTGTTWTFQTYLKAPNAGGGDFFGYAAVAISGDMIVSGAYGEASCSTSIGATTPPFDENACLNSGAAYAFTSPCPTGYFPDPSFAAFTCTACTAGTVQPATLAGYLPCNNCTTGQQQPLAGQATCEDCPSGTYSEVEGQALCTQCPAGRRQPLTGQTLALSCLYCDVGTYSAAGSAECAPCPSDRFAGIGATECTPCFTGFDCTTGQLIACNPGACHQVTNDDPHLDLNSHERDALPATHRHLLNGDRRMLSLQSRLSLPWRL